MSSFSMKRLKRYCRKSISGFSTLPPPSGHGTLRDD
jgi:hypothetical protein